MISSKKNELRTRYRRERHERYLESSFAFILESPEFSKAATIASYISYGDEPSTFELNTAIIATGKVLVLPRVSGTNIEWVIWNGDMSHLLESKRILEPIGDPLVDVSSIEVVVVPALRIDRLGYRLGQGGGFYDRALPRFQAWKIGLIHSDEISGEDLPHEVHDIALDAAATPNLIIRFHQ